MGDRYEETPGGVLIKLVLIAGLCLGSVLTLPVHAQSSGNPPGWRPTGPASAVAADKSVPAVDSASRPLGRFSGQTWANALALCAASHRLEEREGEHYYEFQIQVVRRLIADRGMNGMQAESFADSLMTRREGEAQFWARSPELLADFRADCDGMLAEHNKVR